MEHERLPASVYRRRRIVALVAMLAALALLVVGAVTVVRGIGAAIAGDGGAAEPRTPAPSPTTTTEPSVEYADCAPPELVVAATPDAADVPAGVAAPFTVTITNNGTETCLVDAGEAKRVVTVVSGADRIWSSADCVAADAAERTLLLAPGASDTTQLAWNRVRSAQGCPAGQPAPLPGTYQVSVTLAGASGGPAVFRLG